MEVVQAALNDNILAVEMSGMIELLFVFTELIPLFLISSKGREECTYPARHSKPIET